MVVLGLGSNIGDRQAYLTAALHRLSCVLQDMRLSRVYESAALLPPGAPPEMGYPYFNMAVAGKTNLTPKALFAEIKTIEGELGRIERFTWGPREIDIDILAMDDIIIDIPTLGIPHRELLNRDFALLPLIDVAPDWRDPVTGQLASDIAKAKGFQLGNTLRETGISIHG